MRNPNSKPRTQNADSDWLELTGARYRNLRNVDLRLPLGRLIMVCGPSGAGKSTLFGDLLHPAVACAIKHRKSRLTGREFARLTGFAAEPASARLRPRGRPAPAFDEPARRPGFQSGHRGRPGAHRQDAALHAGHLPRHLRPHPPVLRLAARVENPRLHRLALFLQHDGRPLRDLPGRGPHQARDGLHARHLPAVRRLRRPALRPGARRHHLEGQDHRPGAAAHVRGGGRVFRLPRPARARSAG